MRESITLVPHDPRWARRFADESARISAAADGVLIALHHMGSTAIPAIAAKPVIDMLAVVTSVEALDVITPAIEALGYEAKGEFGIPGRRYFRRDSYEGIRTHHLHAFATGSPNIERHLGFRDYLRAHGEKAREYEELKRALAVLAEGDMEVYSHGKTAFVREIEAHAAVWRAAGG